MKFATDKEGYERASYSDINSVLLIEVRLSETTLDKESAKEPLRVINIVFNK